MVKKPFRGNYLELKVRVSYDKKTDTVHLTSNDKDIDLTEGFHLTLNGGKSAEYALRGLLEKEGLIPKDRFKTIPRTASFSNAENHDRWDQFPLGIYADERETVWLPNQSPNILLGGPTGAGKSIIQRNILFHCIQHPSHWRILGIDLKRVELSPYAKYEESFLGIATSLEDAGAAIFFAHEEMMTRYQELEKAGLNNYQDLENHPKAILLMIDEAFTLLAPTGEKSPKARSEDSFRVTMLEKLNEITRLGRAAGIHTVMASQRADFDFLNGEMKSNFSTRIAAGRMDMNYSMGLLGNNEATKIPAIRGRGYYQEFCMGADFQGYYADPDWLENH